MIEVIHKSYSFDPKPYVNQLMNGNNKEFELTLEQAFDDIFRDMANQYKDQLEARKISIEIDLRKNRNATDTFLVDVTYKIKPKVAAYFKPPEVANGQISIYDIDYDEETGEVTVA